jgi:hypothetical protein
MSEIIVHTYPEMIAAAINYKNRFQTQWDMVQIVGPFTSLDEASDYKNTWDRNKQFKTRLENGRKLFVKTLKTSMVHSWVREGHDQDNARLATVVHRNIIGPRPFASVADFTELHRKRIVK